MHKIHCDHRSSAARLRNRSGFTMLAVLMLSLGVGATTAVFALVDGIMPRSTPSQPCETVMSFSSESSTFAVAKVTSDAIGDLPDLAHGVGPRPVLALVVALALAFLLACTRAASGMLARARVPLVALGTWSCALVVAASSLRALGLPSLGVRAVAFALCISLLAAYFARATERRTVPLTI